MSLLTVEQLVVAVSGKLVRQGTASGIEGVSTDTRSLKKGELFIPLSGENYNGHRFLAEAIRKEAAGVLFSEPLPATLGEEVKETADYFAVQVADPLLALQELSGWYRSQFSLPFIAITGSTGKTSTRDMTASLLKQQFQVLHTMGNLNNEIGLPLTLFQLKPEHQLGVVELGMSGFGEIKRLAELVKPQIGILTNIGMSHIERLGSRENILKAKLELTAFFGPESILLVNGEDPYLATLQASNPPYRVVTYGLADTNEFHPTRLAGGGEQGYQVDIRWQGKELTFSLPVLGVHQVYNFLPALWVALFYQVGPEAIQRGILANKPTKMRLEVHEHPALTVINDAYNASPDSMKAALKVLQNRSGRRIAVFGNILEMGSFSEAGHGQVGESFADTDIEVLLAVGDQAKWIGVYGQKRAKAAQQIYFADDNRQALELLKKILQPRDTVLVKGSRGMKMEEIVNSLLEMRGELIG